jgi:hypothetical protein
MESSLANHGTVIKLQQNNVLLLQLLIDESSEMFRVAAKMRQILAEESHKSARDADVNVLRTLAAVCSHWWKVSATSNGDSRRRLKRLFRC